MTNIDCVLCIILLPLEKNLTKSNILTYKKYTIMDFTDKL
jgi:hypothetical protein